MGNLPCAVFFCIFSIESQKGGEVIMVREASLKDLNAIEAMIKKVVLIMQKQNNPQWDQEYPARKDFQKDIEEGALYVWEEKEKIRGVMCVNFEQPAGCDSPAGCGSGISGKGNWKIPVFHGGRDCRKKRHPLYPDGHL